MLWYSNHINTSMRKLLMLLLAKVVLTLIRWSSFPLLIPSEHKPFKPSTIRTAFRKTGMIPYNLKIVLDRLLEVQQAPHNNAEIDSNFSDEFEPSTPPPSTPPLSTPPPSTPLPSTPPPSTPLPSTPPPSTPPPSTPPPSTPPPSTPPPILSSSPITPETVRSLKRKSDQLLQYMEQNNLSPTLQRHMRAFTKGSIAQAHDGTGS
ncbi:hypothetical protein EV426DRAFT_57574 [Tirmania nivea]|nr:hypothetical protein EV426DRAFT_57574 [Tirmania nivea]